MAKKSPRRKAKRTAGTKRQTFSAVGLHNAIDRALKSLNKKAQTKKRDELLALVKAMRANTMCPPQTMLIDLGV